MFVFDLTIDPVGVLNTLLAHTLYIVHIYVLVLECHRYQLGEFVDYLPLGHENSSWKQIERIH